MKLFNIIKNGIFSENPIFRLVLGMCPTLATTTSIENGLGMGVATSAVLIASNAVISVIRKVIPSQVRIPCYIVVIASLVTVVEMVMQAFVPTLYDSLGIFIPLIVVNCIILGRAEAFAARNTVTDSVFDGIGMGLGFTLALVLLAAVRELFGLIAVISILPVGGFIALGCLLAFFNHVGRVRALKAGKPEPGPLRLDCRHCVIGCGTTAVEEY
ncbi:MAG: electron transport complex subunit E [Lentisphaerae bacterium]|jgi:electron transport complex protein RnfE|nr:electron transport complex subunit E [Lentisphaerota bacterium]